MAVERGGAISSEPLGHQPSAINRTSDILLFDTNKQ